MKWRWLAIVGFFTFYSGLAAGEEAVELRFRSAAPGGETGLLRVMEAGSFPVGTVRLSLFGGGFRSTGTDGFLNYLGQSGYEQSHFVGLASIAWTPLPYLEVFGSVRNSSNLNTLSRPELLQTQGDLQFGAKGFYQLMPYLQLGANMAAELYLGIGGLAPDLASTSLRMAALASFDLRPLVPRVPLRAHVNLGLRVDNSDALIGDRSLDYVEQFALRINRFHRGVLSIGLDAPLPYLRPFAIVPYLEYQLQLPLSVSDDDLAHASKGEDTSYADVIPMVITAGVRATYRTDLSLDLAVDMGLGGEKAYLDGVPSTPPWMLWLGLTYAFDPTRRVEEKIVIKTVEKEVERVVEKPVVVKAAPAVLVGRVSGRVRNALDNQPIAGAILSFVDAGFPPVATEPSEGRYESYNLTAGMIRIAASRAGFLPMTLEVEIQAGEVAKLDFLLEPESKRGTLSGTVYGEGDAPLLANIVITGPSDLQLQSAPATGVFAAPVPPGKYLVKAIAEGYLAKSRQLEIGEDATVLAEFKLSPAPQTRVVIFKANKIEVKKKIHFALGKSVIAEDSLILLDGVIDVLVNNVNIKKLRIEGHTDSSGSSQGNLALSQKRAESVRDYLLLQGIDPLRVEAQGFGEEQPLAPNNTRRGRGENRRVEFIIVQQ